MSAPSTRSSAASPLQRVEHEVQLRATRELLDVDEPQGRAQLRRLIGEVIEEHQAAHRRGRVNDGLVDPEGMAERAFRNLARYGPLTDLLTDDDVWEIMINAPSEIFVRRHSGGSRYHHEVFHDDDHVAAVRARMSIVFAGAPGAGKTTLLSCCAAELEPSLRVVIAEEVFEADVPLANIASLQTRPARADRPEVDLRRLVAGFLRMAPDVAIVGEVRDREALRRQRYRRLPSSPCPPVPSDLTWFRT